MKRILRVFGLLTKTSGSARITGALLGSILGVIAWNAIASPIVGGWYQTHSGQAQSTVALVFLADGRYVEVEDGSSILDPNGHNGMELGTYTWNQTTGAFNVPSVSKDTNGQWGLHVPGQPFPAGVTVTVAGTSLSYTDPIEGTFVASRVFDPASPIVSSWYFNNNPNPGDITVLTFLPNGYFLEGIDPPGGGYMVYGTYTWDKTTGALSSSIIDSTVPPGDPFNGFPFGVSTISSAHVVGDSLMVSSDGQRFNLTNASVPEPGTVALLGLGLAGLAATRRRKLN